MHQKMHKCNRWGFHSTETKRGTSDPSSEFPLVKGCGRGGGNTAARKGRREKAAVTATAPRIDAEEEEEPPPLLHLQVVFPTPPFPPTKIHFRLRCSIMLLSVGSSGSTSGASSNSSASVGNPAAVAAILEYCHVTRRQPTPF